MLQFHVMSWFHVNSCCCYFLCRHRPDLNRDSTVAENLTDRANGQALVAQDEEQRELSTVHFALNCK